MKYFLNFENYNNNNEIYVAYYMGEPMMVHENKLAFRNKIFDISTPIYESQSKQLDFILIEESTILQDIGSGLSNLGSNISTAAKKTAEYAIAAKDLLWDTIKFPSSSPTTFQGMMDWGHWLTGTASLATMLVGLAGAGFTLGLTAAGGVAVAKGLDIFDIGLYVMEFGNHLNNKNFLQAAIALGTGVIMSCMLFTTPTGNSAFMKRITAFFGKIPKPKTPFKNLREAFSHMISNLGEFKSKFKTEYLTKFFGVFGTAVDSFKKLSLKMPTGFREKFISFFTSIKTKVLSMVETVKSAISSPPRVLTNFSDNMHLNKFLDASEITKMRDLLGNDEKSIKIFVDIFDKLGATKDISYLKGMLPIDKMPSFLKNVSKFSQKELDALPNILEKTHITKNIGDFTEKELKQLVSDPKLVNLIDTVTDPAVMKNYIEWTSKCGADSFEKILKSNDQTLIDLFTKNKGNFKGIIESSIFKKLGVGSRSNAFDALAKTVDKNSITSFEKLKLKDFDIKQFAEKVFNNQGKISYKGRTFDSLKGVGGFEDFIKNGDILGKQTQIINIYKFKTAQNLYQAGINFFNTIFPESDVVDVADGDNLGVITTTDLPNISIKSADNRTEEEKIVASQSIQTYLKYVVDATGMITKDERFAPTVESDKTIPQEKSEYGTTEEPNYVNYAKMLQAYINRWYTTKTETLKTDGLIGEKTLNMAYKFFVALGESGNERASKTLELIEKLK